MSRTTKLAALPGGELLFAMARSNGVSAIRLDQNGLPVWHRLYAPTSETGLNPPITNYDLKVYPDGSMAFFGRSLEATPWLMRVDASGAIVWSRQYHGLSTMLREMTVTNAGNFVLIGHTRICSIAADGSFLWSWGYPGCFFESAGELTNGDLLINDYSNLVHTNPSGVFIEAWEKADPFSWIDLISTRGDSIHLEVNEDPNAGGDPRLLLVPSVTDLACLGSPITITPFAAETPTSITDSGFVYVDAIKTWTMSLGPAVEYNQLDLQVAMVSGPARPGFEMEYYAGYMNEGGLSSGPITMTMTYDPMLTFIAAAPMPSSVTSSTITWEMNAAEGFNYSNWWAFQARFQVPVGAPLGDPLSASLVLSQDSAEVTLANNVASVTRTISASYDPNDKLVWPRDFYHIEHDSILDYTIQFQNTGTDTAFTVVLRDTLPLDLDVTTFRMGTSSHPCTYTLTGNGILTFTFENILLPDSNTNEPLSHGLVHFRIKPILPLALGQEITNVADIYFDFNPPVRTPNATVLVTDETGVRPVTKPAQLVVYPVPAKNTLTALLPEGFKPTQAFAVGVDGRRIPMALPAMQAGPIPFATQHLAAGAYVLTLVDREGKRMSARFTKE